MLQYLRLFESLRVNFHDVHIVKVPRSQNSHVDSLATLASSLGDHIPPYVAFLSDRSLPRDVKEAKKV